MMLATLLTTSPLIAQESEPSCCEDETARCVPAEKRKDCAKAVEAIPDLKSQIFDLKVERDTLTGKLNTCKTNKRQCQMSLKKADREVGEQSIGLDSTDVALFSTIFAGGSSAVTCSVAGCNSLKDWSAVPISMIVSGFASKFASDILFDEN